MKRIFYSALMCLCLPLCLLVGPSCGDDPLPPVDDDNAEVFVFMVGDAGFCLFEDDTQWNMDIFVDVLGGPFSDREYTYTMADNNSTGFGVEVPTSGMYTIMVEIYPNSSTACMECCSNRCFPEDTGEPTFEGTETFSGGFFHTVSVDITDCDCC